MAHYLQLDGGALLVGVHQPVLKQLSYFIQTFPQSHSVPTERDREKWREQDVEGGKRKK